MIHVCVTERAGLLVPCFFTWGLDPTPHHQLDVPHLDLLEAIASLLGLDGVHGRLVIGIRDGHL